MKQNRRDHCILCIRSEQDQPLLQAMLPRRRHRLEITDWDSPEGKRQLEFRRSRGLVSLRPQFRYYAVLSSSGHVKGDELFKHIEWLFSNFRASFNLTEWTSIGVEFELSFAWWGGLGTAYGPIIQPDLADLLSRHRAPLEISIY